MTEQERPRTVETFVALWEVIQDRYARPAVRRIVEEALEAARTEGRQQAVRDAVDLIMSEPYWPRLGAIRRKRIAERVAGLNASESPEVEDIAGDLWHQREGWHSVGNASESPPPEQIVHCVHCHGSDCRRVAGPER